MDNKAKILYLYRLLYEKTDEENPISTKDIIAALNKQGITATRKTVSSDIASLIEFGIDILIVRSSQNLYYIGNREFELPEIKVLIDAVESSKLITAKKSKKLVGKLTKLVSAQQAKKIKKDIFIDNRIKPNNEKIYYNIDIIHAAILNSSQLAFKYTDYNRNKELIYKHQGLTYNLSPYALAWSNDKYYVIGYSVKHNGLSRFRVDKMAKVEIVEDPYICAPKDFIAAEYVKTIFNMYDGKKETVEIKCDNDTMNFIIDKFGENVKTEILDSDTFKAIVDVSVSPTFYSWIFQFCGKMTILSPEEVKKEYSVMLKSTINSML